VNIAKSVRKGLIDRGLQQKDLAESLRCTSSHISNITNGKTISLKGLEKIAKALDYKVSDFIALGE